MMFLQHYVTYMDFIALFYNPSVILLLNYFAFGESSFQMNSERLDRGHMVHDCIIVNQSCTIEHICELLCSMEL